jgi:plastocyanin domain-containing protein
LNPFAKNSKPVVQTNASYQEINMSVTRSGWVPNTFTVKKGIPVRWNIDVQQLTSCNKELIFREFNIDQKFSREGEKLTIEFTPTKTGRFQFTCWMGMITGTMVVVE